MKTPMKSIILVALQFACIIILLLNDASIFDSGIALLLSVLGVTLGCWALIHNDIYNFNITPELKRGGQFIKDGPYKYSRHPMYLALILVMLGVTISVNQGFDYFIFLVLCVVLYLKSSREEYLWGLECKEYSAYQKKTKMFIPFVF